MGTFRNLTVSIVVAGIGFGTAVTPLAGQEAVVPAPAATDAAPTSEVKPAPAATAPRPGVVNANVLNIRARPGTQYEVVGQLKQGDSVSITGEKDGWYSIVPPPDCRAWIVSAFVGANGACNADRVRVHAGPGLAFTTFAYVGKDEQLQVIGEPANEWQRIRPPASSLVWVNSLYIKTDQPATVAAPTTPAAAEAETPAAAPAATAVEKGSGDQPAPAPTPVEAEKATVQPAETTPSTLPQVEAQKPDKTVAPVPMSPAPQPQPEVIPDAKPPAASTEGMPPPANANEATAEAPAVLAAAPAALTPAPVPAVPEAVVTPPAPAASVDATPSSPAAEAVEAVVNEGLVMALPDAAQYVVSHYLTTPGSTAYEPLCYLRSDKINLRDWENREVKVYGKEVQYPGWKHPVIEVTGVKLRQN